MEYETDVACLVMSRGRSMLPSDVQLMARPEGVEVRPDLISKTFSEVWAGLSGELLDRLRRYITTARMGELSLTEQVMKAETRLSSLCSEGGDTKALFLKRSDVVTRKENCAISELVKGRVREVEQIKVCVWLSREGESQGSEHYQRLYVFLFFISRVNVWIPEVRCRFMFYSILGRLLMVDLGDDEVKLEAFMILLTSVFEQLGLDLPTHPSYRGRWRWR